MSQAMAEQIEELTQEHMPTDTNAPAAAPSAAAAPSLGECDLQDFTKALKLVRSKDPKCARFTKEFFEDSKNFAK